MKQGKGLSGMQYRDRVRHYASTLLRQARGYGWQPWLFKLPRRAIIEAGDAQNRPSMDGEYSIRIHGIPTERWDREEIRLLTSEMAILFSLDPSDFAEQEENVSLAEVPEDDGA